MEGRSQRERRCVAVHERERKRERERGRKGGRKGEKEREEGEKYLLGINSFSTAIRTAYSLYLIYAVHFEVECIF